MCCLYKGEVELPTDVSGIIYKPVSDTIESQEYAIIRELVAAGFTIKLSRG